MNPSKKKISNLVYLKTAIDPEQLDGPTQEELVDEFDRSPQAHIEEYFQVIIRTLKNQYGAEVNLVNPHIATDMVGSPTAGFDIIGSLDFQNGRPLELQKEFEDYPITFRAYIADGALVEPIFLDFG